MESLPDDIISKDFEAEPWKYSSHLDYTVDTGNIVTFLSIFYISVYCLQTQVSVFNVSGTAAANMEGAIVFSPESFLPRYAVANLTVHILGRAFNLMEVKREVDILITHGPTV